MISGVGEGARRKPTLDDCFLVLNSLDYRPSVMHQCQDQLCLICHERNHKNNRPSISYIFSLCIHERDLNSGTLSLHSYTALFVNYGQFYQERLKMFRLFFLMTLAIFFAASFGTSQNNSSNQVTSQRTKF